MEVRDAVLADAEAACTVLRRSITELCTLDHGNRREALGAWLVNKTPENVRTWIEDPANRVLVAADGGDILAVGAVRSGGEITLNYVSPDARFRGVSRALLAKLEATAAAAGNDCCRLTSTETALRFYLGAGYRHDGEPERRFGTHSSYPMIKRLAPTG